MKGAALALLALAGCRSAPAPVRSVSPDAVGRGRSATAEAGSARSGRWVVWAGSRRTWGSFISAEGAGPLWPLDVAGSARWSDDGRWLVGCGSGFLAARWMGSARPSRIAVSSGACELLKWAPRGDRLLVFSRGSTQARLLTLTAGEPPTLASTALEIALAAPERLETWSYLAWSPRGDGLLATVGERAGSSIRWIDVERKPGTVRQLLTQDGFEASGECWWSPNGNRIACFASQPASRSEPQKAPRQALALFEITDGRVSGRSLFETPWFAIRKLAWVDDDRLVFQDRDATRLLDVTGSESPITLSATAEDFDVAIAPPGLAYLNQRGLCFREAGDGPERLLVPGRWQGVHLSRSGRYLLSYRPDQRAVLVVTVSPGAQPEARQTSAARAGFRLTTSFSAGETRLLTREVSDQVMTNEPEPLRFWSLPSLDPLRLVPAGFEDRWLAQSPDDSALVTRREDHPSSVYLGLVQDQHTTLQPLGESASDPAVRWQPGQAIAVTQAPAPPTPSEPARQRVALAADHPLSLGTAYVRGSRECSGALIDSQYVVTAEHCVSGARGPVQVVLGRGLDWEREYSVPTFRILHHPKARYVEQLDLFEYDFALIELPEAPPPQARPLPLARAESAALGSEVFLAGFGGDRGVGLTTQPELRYGTSQLVAADTALGGALAWRSSEGAENAGCFGDSGGPVLVRGSDGGFALLGLHFGSAGTDYARVCGNEGVGGNLVAERAWLNQAADTLALSRRGSGPPRPRATRF